MPDFNLPGWEPADEPSARAQEHFLAAEEVYDLLTEVNADENGSSDDFLLFEDPAGYFDTGLPAVAAHLHYGDNSTFTLTSVRMPAFALAAAWLVGRGADAQAFVHASGHRGAPADARSAAHAQRLLEAPGRYTLAEYGTEPDESWAMLHDSDPAAAERPFLLLVEYGQPERGYLLREGSFASPQEVQQWLEAREVPLPSVAAGQIQVQAGAQASAARARSTAEPLRPGADRPAAVPTAAGRRAAR